MILTLLIFVVAVVSARNFLRPDEICGWQDRV